MCFTGVARKTFPELIVAGIFGVDARVDFDAPVLEAVPLVHHPYQFLTLLVGLKVKVLVGVNEAVAGKGQIGLDAGLGHRLGGGVGIVIKVRNGGDAEAQALGDGQKRGGFRAAGVHLGLLLQQRLQRLGVAQIVGIAAQASGGQVGVAVHKTGDGNHAGAVDDGFRRFRRGGLADGDNFTAVDTDIRAENHFQLRIHGHGGDVGNQSVQRKQPFD